MTLSAISGYDNQYYSGAISNVNNALTFTLLADTEYTAKIILSNITGDFELNETFSKK